MILKLINSRSLNPIGFNIYQRYYAKIAAAGGAKSLGKKVGKIGPIAEKKVMPVVTDPEKLVNYCCGSNYFIEGEDVKIKPNDEYPDWLWKLHTAKPKTLEELDPETKAYWKKLRSLGLNRNNLLSKIKKF
ncbi:hypothetical protein PVAND_007219 [Polypedilum vanderplanki]|uniref:Large ribosomal subunit protein mL54 n=1 Tax=Polypedilum vanderplanki TaxID=319348 RepID=A0A9J6C6B0_POLVA|nr:hypothetical protein PVAND_007219 [Polypedilum vanderplanki]